MVACGAQQHQHVGMPRHASGLTLGASTFWSAYRSAAVMVNSATMYLRFHAGIGCSKAALGLGSSAAGTRAVRGQVSALAALGGAGCDDKGF